MKLPLWLVVALVLAAYSGAPAAGFVWDDHSLFERNGALFEPTWAKVWLDDLWCCGPATTSGYHRPLLTVTFLLDHMLFGVNAAWAHVHSVLWHVLAVVLVSRLLSPRIGSLRANIAALLFGLHPIQSEAVLWIAARNDLMVTAGVLATLWAADARRFVLTAIFAVCTALSKESGYILPVYLLLWRFAGGAGLPSRRSWSVASQGGASEARWGRADLAVFAGLALATVLRSQSTLGGVPLTHTEAVIEAPVVASAAVTVASWVVWPWPLTTTATLFMPPAGPATWVAALTTVLLLGYVVRREPRTLWLLGIAAVAYAPAVMPVRWYATLGERYLYLPMFGVVAAVVTVWPLTRVWGMVLGVITVASLGALHLRAPDWATEETLFAAAVRRAPDGYAWNLYGVELTRQDRWAEATAAFDQSVMAEPQILRACKRIVDTADHVLSDDDLVRLSERWAARGCRGHNGFDGSRAAALAGRGLWAEAAAIADAAVHNDDLRRDELVRAAVDAREGDLLSLAARALVWPGGQTELMSQVTLFTNARH